MTIGGREKLLLHFMSHLASSGFTAGFHLRTGLYKLCVSVSSCPEAAAGMDTGFLNQLEKHLALLGIHNAVCGKLLLVKTKLPEFST